MTFKEIQELLKLVSKLELTEFKLKDGEFELSIRSKNFEKSKPSIQAIPAPQSVAPSHHQVPQPFVPIPAPVPAPGQESQPEAAAPAEEAKPASKSGEYLPIKSPIVGTFYRSPSPDKSAYVKVGDVIEVGTVVCIVEAMKLFNEIESEIAGKIVKVLVEDAQPVEYDQVLFLVDPNG